ncbi:MAG: XdhC family protein [Deltaproteobacteria bacterium]|nr:XdhC family protein [Deltaproteobacteria bacterium]
MNARLYEKLYRTLNNGKDAVLIRIVRREGSAPRGVGSICMIDSDGILSGTIGGGLLEYEAVKQAKVLLEKRITSRDTVTMTATEIAQAGMICGGMVELFFEPVFAGDAAAVACFKAIFQFIQEGGSGTLVTLIRDKSDALAPGRRMLVKKGGDLVGNIPFADFPGHPVNPCFLESKGAGDLFAEPVGERPELLLFGGGHISTFVAPLAEMVGFRLIVFDDLADFANKTRFPQADEIYAMPYSKAFGEISITGSSYIVIVTRGHMGDKDVLELALKSAVSPAYIGMIGSLRKRDTIYNALMEEGVSRQSLARVYSPIGLDIGSRTPEEIAVSIIAEIINVKAGGSKTL